MTRVTGIGGMFFKARDPAGFRIWYRHHLCLDVQDQRGVAPRGTGSNCGILPSSPLQAELAASPSPIRRPAMPNALTRSRPDLGLLILRLGLAVIVLFHGIFKLRNGVDWMHGPLGAHGLPFFLAYGTYIAEVAAPVLLIVGAATRLGAAIIAFDLLGAIFLARADAVTKVSPGGGGWAIEIEAAIVFMALALAFTGPGKYRLVRTPAPWD